MNQIRILEWFLNNRVKMQLCHQNKLYFLWIFDQMVSLGETSFKNIKKVLQATNFCSVVYIAILFDMFYM